MQQIQRHTFLLRVHMQ